MKPMTLPEPMRVSDTVIARCRSELESRHKRLLRAAILPALKTWYQFEELGEGFQWGLPLSITPNQARVGRYVYIGAHGSMNGPVVIGDLCMLSSHVRFVGNDHRPDVLGSPTRLEPALSRPVTILETDCWIGQGAMIREGVTIGRGAVVGSGSFVHRSVAPYTIVAGVPAKLLRMRFNDREIVEHERSVHGRSS